VVLEEEWRKTPTAVAVKVASFMGVNVKDQLKRIQSLTLPVRNNKISDIAAQDWWASVNAAAMRKAFNEETARENAKVWPCGEMTIQGSIFGESLLPDCSAKYADCNIQEDKRQGAHVNGEK